jgi:asparagine synthase (glutamine-hydrolysing)
MIPQGILERKDKMGFPVPLPLWMKTDKGFRSFIGDIFNSRQARERFYLSPSFNIDKMIDAEGMFNRNIWALLSLELWQQQFHDVHRPFSLKDTSRDTVAV